MSVMLRLSAEAQSEEPSDTTLPFDSFRATSQATMIQLSRPLANYQLAPEGEFERESVDVKAKPRKMMKRKMTKLRQR